MTLYSKLLEASEQTPQENLTLLRRVARGCKSSEFYQWPDQPFDDMDSPLAVQQYIQQVIRKDPFNVDEILKPPEGQDLNAWKFEHLRQFCMQLNRLATKLQVCCHRETCNQMTATEQWIFLCAAHKTPNECSAIDYTRHTLDGAASLLNSNKYFPSRVTIKESSVAKLGSLSRRIYRIFSHAYYHHFPVFDQFERETFLCKRFTKFVSIYNLVSKDNLIVPIEGETSATASTASSNTETSSQSSIAEPQSAKAPDVSMDATRVENTIINSPISDNIRLKDLGAKVGETNSEAELAYTATNEMAALALNASSVKVFSNTNTIIKGGSSIVANSATLSDEIKPEPGDSSPALITTVKSVPGTPKPNDA